MRVTRRKALIAVAVATAVLIPVVAVGVSALGQTDDKIPGVKLPASPVSDTLDTSAYTNDWDDIYAVKLKFNERLNLDLTGPSGSDFDLWVFKPGTTTADSTDQLDYVVAASQTASTSVEKLRYPASKVGTYYVDVFASDTYSPNKGAYKLTWSKTAVPAPTVKHKAPATVTWDATSSIAATATLNGTALSGVRVLWQTRPQGTTTWSSRNLGTDRLPTTKTTSKGAFSRTIKPTRPMEYRYVVWPGSSSGWLFGPAIAISPTPKLGAPRVSDAVKKANTSFSVWGYLYPRHTSGAKHVTITAKLGSTTVTKTAVNYDHATSAGMKDTKYQATLTLPKKGSWTLVASTPKDSLHAATTSKPLVVVVK